MKNKSNFRTLPTNIDELHLIVVEYYSSISNNNNIIDEYGRINTWFANTPAPQNLSGLFSDIIDNRNDTDDDSNSIASWDVSEVIIMDRMFDNCSNTALIQSITSWDKELTKLKSIDEMFFGATVFKATDNSFELLDWDLPELLSMENTFKNIKEGYSYSSKQVDISTWKIPKIINISGIQNSNLLLPKINISAYVFSQISLKSFYLFISSILINIATYFIYFSLINTKTKYSIFQLIYINLINFFMSYLAPYNGIKVPFRYIYFYITNSLNIKDYSKIFLINNLFGDIFYTSLINYFIFGLLYQFSPRFFFLNLLIINLILFLIGINRILTLGDTLNAYNY